MVDKGMSENVDTHVCWIIAIGSNVYLVILSNMLEFSRRYVRLDLMRNTM